MPKISLCVIARNEERFIRDCLRSANGSVDEMIVVDTGSTDRTREIAAAEGARVVEFDWRDDFSAARNAALTAATGSHMLILDADERLADPRGALRRAAGNERFTMGLLALHDASTLDAQPEAVLAGRARLWDPTWIVRFFVAAPELRFTRRVHETVGADPVKLGEFLARRRSTIEKLDAAIVHFGEVPALRAERSKRARNTQLLQRALSEDETDGDLAGYLAMELIRAGDAAAARALGERHLGPFLTALRRLPKTAPKPSPVQLASVLATCLVQAGEYERALTVVRESLQCCIEPHPNLMFLEGAALERLERYADAKRAFESCLAAHGQAFTIPVNPGATDRAPRLRLANLALITGDPAGALAHLDACAPWQGPFELPALLLQAEALLQAGDATRAITALAPILSRTEAPPDLFALAARAAEQLGSPEPSLRAAAERCTPEQWLESRRKTLIGTTRS
ncbi:MAG: glycosyltransferase [Planctomycetes bacterium]|nr:glycosyltransferase [Planctomycetota bacterium]